MKTVFRCESFPSEYVENIKTPVRHRRETVGLFQHYLTPEAELNDKTLCL